MGTLQWLTSTHTLAQKCKSRVCMAGCNCVTMTVPRRWLHPAAFVLTAAFDSLDAEAHRSGEGLGVPDKDVDWKAADDAASSGRWGFKRWARHMLNFHGWR